MSGAQGKAGLICKCVTVIAEINKDALYKRYNQGWITEVSDNLDTTVELIKKYRKEKTISSIGYLGNIVDLWERLAKEEELLVELGSDQTSLHNPFKFEQLNLKF
jgi:urocanate hydratase